MHSKMLYNTQKVVWIEIMELLKGFNLLVIKVFLAMCLLVTDVSIESLTNERLLE